METETEAETSTVLETVYESSIVHASFRNLSQITVSDFCNSLEK